MQIAVMTSDKTANNLFIAFVEAFRHHWPDCPWPIVAVGETVSVSDFPTMLQGLVPEGTTVEQRLQMYLDTYDGETIMVLSDDMILYAHQVNTPVLTRAHKTLVDSGAIGAVLFDNRQSREPEQFYDGFLGEFVGFVGTAGLLTWNTAIWRTSMLKACLDGYAWPRTLGVYHPPLVYVRMLCDQGKLSGVGIKTLMAHRSVALPIIDTLVPEFTIRELEDLRHHDSADVRKSMSPLLERYGYFNELQKS